MNPDERNQDTLPTLETIAESLGGLRQEIIAGFQTIGAKLGSLEDRIGSLETHVGTLETVLEGVRLQAVGLNVRLERLGATVLNQRADVMVLQEEMHAWGKDTQALQRKVEALIR